MKKTTIVNQGGDEVIPSIDTSKINFLVLDGVIYMEDRGLVSSTIADNLSLKYNMRVCRPKPFEAQSYSIFERIRKKIVLLDKLKLSQKT